MVERKERKVQRYKDDQIEEKDNKSRKVKRRREGGREREKWREGGEDKKAQV